MLHVKYWYLVGEFRLQPNPIMPVTYDTPCATTFFSLFRPSKHAGNSLTSHEALVMARI